MDPKTMRQTKTMIALPFIAGVIVLLAAIVAMRIDRESRPSAKADAAPAVTGTPPLHATDRLHGEK
ncbi:MAG: hypothetical protein ACXU89_22665 [Xanthobacteraceae bacterium]